MRVYVSGPLQGSTDLTAARSFYDAIASCIRQAGDEAYVPHHYTDPQHAASLSAETIFDYDLDALESCDAVIAHIGLPSTGVGAEIALSVAHGRPVLGIKRVGEKSSRFTEGLLLRAGDQVCAFSNLDELAQHIRTWLEGLHAGHDVGQSFKLLFASV